MRLDIYYSRTLRRDLGRLWKRHGELGIDLLPLGRCGHFNFKELSSLAEGWHMAALLNIYTSELPSRDCERLAGCDDSVSSRNCSWIQCDKNKGQQQNPALPHTHDSTTALYRIFLPGLSLPPRAMMIMSILFPPLVPSSPCLLGRVHSLLYRRVYTVPPPSPPSPFRRIG